MFIVEKIERAGGFLDQGSSNIPVIAGIFKSEEKAVKLYNVLKDEYNVRIRQIQSDLN